MRPVKLCSDIKDRLNHREWGLPSGVFTGKVWVNFVRTCATDTITCVLPAGSDHVRYETRVVVIVENQTDEWMPAAWRDAIWRYARRWPGSAHWAPPLLRINEQQLNAFLRSQGRDLAEADDIGAHGIAENIGAFSGFRHLGGVMPWDRP